jgi:hypothetical protein
VSGWARLYLLIQVYQTTEKYEKRVKGPLGRPKLLLMTVYKLQSEAKGTFRSAFEASTAGSGSRDKGAAAAAAAAAPAPAPADHNPFFGMRNGAVAAAVRFECVSFVCFVMVCFGYVCYGLVCFVYAHSHKSVPSTTFSSMSLVIGRSFHVTRDRKVLPCHS